MNTESIGAFAVVGVWLAFIAGWFTHLFWFFGAVTSGTATGGTWAVFLIGLLFAPIGSIHGFWLWFN